MKRFFTILFLVLFGLFGVVNDGWSINSSWTIGTTPLSSLVENDTIVWGTSPSNLVYVIENNWAKMNSTKSNWLAFKVIKENNKYYLKELSSNNYVYSLADKKLQLNKSDKTALSINADKTLYGGSNVGKYTYNTGGSGIRPYKSNTYTLAFIYKVTNNVSYTITAQSNNNSYGTVSLTATTITATPAEGYRVSTSNPYTVSPVNSATVSQNGNTFTVTPSANTTITVNFEAIPKYKVDLKIDETLYATVRQTSEGETINLTDSIPNISRACELNGWQFVGWINSNDKDNRNLITTITPTKNTTLYALFKIKNNEYIEYITDTIYASKLQASGSEYIEFTLNEISGAKYYGYTANAKDTILQLNSGIHHDKTLKLHSGIITKLSGGFLSNIKVKWNDSTATDRMIEIYQSNNPYNTQEDLFGNGINYDSIKYRVSNELQLKDSLYLGIRAHNGAVFIDTIYITWSDGIGYEYSTNPQCFETNISVAEWYEDHVEFDIGNYDSIHIYNGEMNSCDSIRIKITNDNDKECIRWFKVPIFVDGTTNLTLADSLCDIVILGDKIFEPKNGNKSKNVYVYPGGILNIKENRTFAVNSLTLRRDNDSVPQLLYNGNLDIKNGMFFEMRTDGEDWRWLTLPDSIRLKEISGKSEVLLKYYNGEIRANNGRGGWQFLQNDTTFGLGVIFGVDDDRKMIYKFELDTNILTLEKGRKKIQIKEFSATNKPKNDLGWNLVGNPFMSTYNVNPAFGTYIYCDSLVEEKINGQWTGRWITVEKHLRYIVVPSNKKDQHIIDAGGYEQICLEDGYPLKPFTSFFVQSSKNDSIIFYKTFHNGSSAPKRNLNIKNNDETFLRIRIGSLKTGCYISEKFTDDYEIGDDMESLYSTYQLINGYKLLYSAINDSIINNGIEIHTNSGLLSLDDKTNIDEFSEINILYNGQWFDLLGNQTIPVNGVFILQARRKINNTTTNYTDINADVKTIKFVGNDGNIYILKNNCIFTILGNKIK